MITWLLKNKVRSFGLAYLAVTVVFVAYSRFETRHGYPPDFLDRTPDGSQPVPRAIVVAARKEADTNWIEFLTTPNSTVTYDSVIYRTDGENLNANATLHLSADKGYEANTYLSFIIDNYEFLPQYTVFIHGYYSAWHQEAGLLDTLQNLKFEALDTDGYVNLRCDWYPSCPAEIRPLTHDGIVWGPGLHTAGAEKVIAEAWPELFPGVEIPHTISSQCCAQFAVTRERVRSRTRKTYVRMREWLLRTALNDEVSSMVFEKLWAYIFTYEPVHCPPPPVCACKYFGSCDPNQQWPRPPMADSRL